MPAKLGNSHLFSALCRVLPHSAARAVRSSFDSLLVLRHLSIHGNQANYRDPSSRERVGSTPALLLLPHFERIRVRTAERLPRRTLWPNLRPRTPDQGSLVLDVPPRTAKAMR